MGQFKITHHGPNSWDFEISSDLYSMKLVQEVLAKFPKDKLKGMQAVKYALYQTDLSASNPYINVNPITREALIRKDYFGLDDKSVPSTLEVKQLTQLFKRIEDSMPHAKRVNSLLTSIAELTDAKDSWDKTAATVESLHEYAKLTITLDKLYGMLQDVLTAVAIKKDEALSNTVYQLYE